MKLAQLTPDHSTTLGLSIVEGEAAATETYIGFTLMQMLTQMLYIDNTANGFSLLGVTYIHTHTCTQRIVASDLHTVTPCIGIKIF